MAALKSDPRVKDVALALYSLPAKGVGLYAFVETLDADEKVCVRGSRERSLNSSSRLHICLDVMTAQSVTTSCA